MKIVASGRKGITKYPMSNNSDTGSGATGGEKHLLDTGKVNGSNTNAYILQERIERAFDSELEYERQQIAHERFCEHDPISTGNHNLQKPLEDSNASVTESRSPPIQEERDQDDDG